MLKPIKSFKIIQMLSISSVYKFLLNFTKQYKLRNGVHNIVMKRGIFYCREVA